MVRFSKNIIRRVLISVGVILILSFLRSYFNFLVLDVNATEIPTAGTNDLPPEVLVGINTTTDSNTTVSNYVGLNTNVDYLEQNNSINFNYFVFGVDGADEVPGDNYLPVKVSPEPGFSSSPFSFNTNYRLYRSTLPGVMSFIQNLRFLYGGNFKMKYNNHYTLFYLITKDDDMVFNSDPDITIEELLITNSGGGYLTSSDISNLDITYEVIYNSNEHTISNQTNYAYIKIDFDLFENQYSSPTDELSLFKLDLSLTNQTNFPLYYYQELPIKFLMRGRGTDNNNGGYYSFSLDYYFIENGVISLSGQNCDTSSGICHSSSGGRHDDYDYVYASDIEVLDSIGVCDDNDIICHIKRVFDMIWRFFVRITNFFKELFDDSFNFDLDTNSDMTPVSNLLSLPITLLNRFLTAFQGTCSPYALGSLLGTTLILPCINLNNYLGSSLVNIIDIICSSFIFYNIALLCIHMFDKWTSLTDDFDELYSPKHEYHGKHEGGR